MIENIALHTLYIYSGDETAVRGIGRSNKRVQPMTLCYFAQSYRRIKNAPKTADFKPVVERRNILVLDAWDSVHSAAATVESKTKIREEHGRYRRATAADISQLCTAFLEYHSGRKHPMDTLRTIINFSGVPILPKQEQGLFPDFT